MNILKELGYTVKPLNEFLEHLTAEDKETVKQFKKMIVCYTKADTDIEKLFQESLDSSMTWNDNRNLIKGRAGSRGSSWDKLNNLLAKDEWGKLHKIIGSKLMLFLFETAVLCEEVAPRVLLAIDSARMSRLIRNAEKELNDMHSVNKKDEVNILQIIASKCKPQSGSKSVICSSPEAGPSTQTEANFPNISLDVKHSEVILESACPTGKCITLLADRNEAALINESNQNYKNQRDSQKTKGNTDISIKPRKKTRRSKRKIRSTSSINTDNRKGYKETKALSNQYMMYSRSRHEVWPLKHILTLSPATLEGACKVLDHILLKDVGEKVPVSGRVKDDLSDLKILLLNFIKTHKSRSSYRYLLTHHLEREFKKTTDVHQETKSTDLGTYVRHESKRLFTQSRDQDNPNRKKHKQEQSVNRNVTEQDNNCIVVVEGNVENFVSGSESPLARKDVDVSKSLEVVFTHHENRKRKRHEEEGSVGEQDDDCIIVFEENAENSVSELETHITRKDTFKSLEMVFTHSMDHQNQKRKRHEREQSVNRTVTVENSISELEMRKDDDCIIVFEENAENSVSELETHITRKDTSKSLEMVFTQRKDHQNQKRKRHEREQSVNRTVTVENSISELEMRKDAFWPNLQQKPTQIFKQTKRKLQPVEQKVVSKFVKEILKKVVPTELFGCKWNLKLFERLCSKLTCSGKNQNFSLGSLMCGMRTSKIPWLDSVDHAGVKEIIFAKVVCWLLEEFVMVLLRTHFFVTDVSQERNKLFFYRSRVGQRIKDQAMSHMIDSKKLHIVTKEQNTLLEGMASFPGRAVLRFMPKKTGGARPVIRISNRKEISNMVEEAQIYLTQIAALNSWSIKPVATRKLHSIWSTLWRKNNWSNQRLFFVRTDISDAYGSICLVKLCNILKKKISKGNTYTFKKFKCMTLKKGKLRYFYKFAFDHLPYVMPEDSILIEVEKGNRCVDGTALLSFISKMVHNYVVHDGNKQFVMLRGQPQGGRLSSVLCDLYYSELDGTYLREFQNDEDLLLRAVDDYLFVSADVDRAGRFLEMMERGFPEYGCYVNSKKTQTNVPREHGSICTKVNYCGYVLDTELLQITGDYARYEHQDIAHSMTLMNVKHPGKFLEKRMSMVGVLKMNALTLDRLFNSRRTVLTNIFHAALLHAFRFHGIVRNFFDRKNLNQVFLSKVVYECASRIGCQVSRVTSKFCQDSEVNFTTVCWITYRAFFLRMSRVGSYYPHVLRSIRCLLRSMSQKMEADVLHELEDLTSHMPDSFETVS